MLMAGINFVLHFRLLTGRGKEVWRDAELRYFLGVIVVATVILVVPPPTKPACDFADTFRDAVFQTLSILTTTGLCDAPISSCGRRLPLLVLLCLMVLGGMSGSTGGGIKSLRALLAVSSLRTTLHRLIHPHAVRPVKYGGAVVSESVLSGIWAFLTAYLLIALVGTAVVAAHGYDLLTAISAGLTSIGNVGPGLGADRRLRQLRPLSRAREDRSRGLHALWPPRDLHAAGVALAGVLAAVAADPPVRYWMLDPTADPRIRRLKVEPPDSRIGCIQRSDRHRASCILHPCDRCILHHASSIDAVDWKRVECRGFGAGGSRYLKEHRAKIGIVFLIVFIDLVGFGIVIPILPLYAEEYGPSPVIFGLLMASFSIMQFIFAPILGRLSDRIGRRPVLLVSLVGSAVGYVLFGIAGSMGMLFASRIIDGISGGNISTAQAVIADITGPEDRAKGMGIIGAAFGLGFILGPAIGALLVTVAPWMPGIAAAVASLIAFLAGSDPSPGDPRHRGEARGAATSSQSAAAWPRRCRTRWSGCVC